MALMAAHGEITPMPTAAVFADTQAEPESVMRWLSLLEGFIAAAKYPFPVLRVTGGNLTDESLKIRERRDGAGGHTRNLIPAFVMQKDGSKGLMGRSCTSDFKVRPLTKFLRKLAGVKHGQKTVGAVQWIGISLDEAHRMKPSRERWVEHRWPLIDLGMKRYDCLRWMEKMGYPKPPRSACIYCPFHSDAEWRRLKDEEPDEFAKAAQFERDLQAASLKNVKLKGVPFLHSSCVPIGTVDLSTDIERGQGEMFGNDCTGLCGV